MDECFMGKDAFRWKWKFNGDNMSTAINNPQNIQERYPLYYGLDEDVTPAIPMRGLLGWTGTAWEKLMSDGAGALKIVGPYYKLDQKTTQQEIETGADTSIQASEVSLDLGSLLPGLTLKAPIWGGNAYSSNPSAVPFPYAIGVWDNFAIFDKSGAGAVGLLFSNLDFTSQASIEADLANARFTVDWPWCPSSDDSYQHGLKALGLRWKGGAYCDTVTIDETYGAEIISNGTDFSAGWTYTTPSWEVVTGTMQKTADGTDTLEQAVADFQDPLTVGNLYKLEIVVTSIANGISIKCAGATVGDSIYQVGTYIYYFTAINNTDGLVITPTDNALRITITKISVLPVNTHDIEVQGKATYREADWYGGNTIYVPTGVDITSYINDAVAGDTLVLGSGTYYINTTVTINKRLKIMGQGTAITQVQHIATSGNTFNWTQGQIEFEGFKILSSTPDYVIQNRNITGGDSLITDSIMKNMEIIQFNVNSILQDITTIYCLNADLHLTDTKVTTYNLTSNKSTCLKVETSDAIATSGASANDARSCDFLAISTAGGDTVGIDIYDNQTGTTDTIMDVSSCLITAFDISTSTLGASVWTHGGTYAHGTAISSILNGNIVKDNGYFTLIDTSLNGTFETKLYQAVIFNEAMRLSYALINLGALIEGVTQITADYTLDTTSNVPDKNIVSKATTPITVSLTEITDIGRNITIKNLGTDTLTVDAYTSDTIDGELTQDIIGGESITLVADTANSWIVI